MVKELSVTECIGDGWEQFKQKMGIAIGGYLLSILLSLPGAIPYIGWLYALFVSPALAGGMYLLFLHIARGEETKIDDLFEGFHRYGAMIGVQFLLGIAMVVGMLPGIIVFVILSLGGKAGTAFGVGIVIINGFVLLWLLTRYALVYFLLMDHRELGLFDALSRSAELTRGNRHNLILLFLASFVIIVAALICLIIPFFFAVPTMATAFAMSYHKLRQYEASRIQGPEQAANFGTGLTLG
jgi:uncharacterized membrane protein